MEKLLANTVNWLTHKWVGSRDRDLDLREGMQVTLQRITAAAESDSLNRSA